MYKYAQLNRFHHDSQLQLYMYAFMYVYLKTITLKDHFTSTKTYVLNYNKMSTPGTLPKHWIGFNYIRSEDYELDHNFDYIKLKNNHTTHPMIRLIFFVKSL